MEHIEGVDHNMSISSSSPKITVEEPHQEESPATFPASLEISSTRGNGNASAPINSSSSPEIIVEEPHQEESPATFPASLEISSTRGNGNASAPINSSSSPEIIVEEPHQEESPATFPASLEISSTRGNDNASAPINSSSSPEIIMEQEQEEIMAHQEDLPANGNGIAPINSSVNPRWHIGLQIMLIVVQVVAAVFVLLLSSSRHERPTNLLRVSTILYAIGCVAALPLVFWGDYNADQAQNYCIQRNIQFETFGYCFREDNPQRTVHSESLSTRQKLMMGLRIFLNVAFGIWLLTTFGRILTEGASSAPILYWFNVGYLGYTCFVHILAFMVTCARVPQLLSGCSTETINSLPVHIFNMDGNNGVVVAQDNDNQRVISENEVACTICIQEYIHNDELRELPCSHLFHKDCVDTWLRIKAICPFCRSVIRQVPS